MYWLTGILGVMLVVAPSALNYTNNAAAFWSSIIMGGILVLASFLEALQNDKNRLEYAFMAVLGVVALFVPFVFNFNTVSAALWTTIAAGILAVLISGAKLITMTDANA